MTPPVIAIDPSLTRTGVCRPDGSTFSIATKPDGFASPIERINHIVSELCLAAIPSYWLVVIEGAMMSARVGPETMWLHGIIRSDLHRLDATYVDIAGASRQKYACGNQKDRSKDAVLAAAIRSGSDCTNNDEADAWWLWRLATDAHTLDPTDNHLPAYRREVLAKYTWPTYGDLTPTWPKVSPTKKKATA